MENPVDGSMDGSHTNAKFDLSVRTAGPRDHLVHAILQFCLNPAYKLDRLSEFCLVFPAEIKLPLDFSF